jgi:tripartite-type tricarboxylate transporter receptor subunit TctC
MSEAGIEGVVASAWFGVLAPAGTPAVIVQKVHAEFSRALSRPELRQQLTERGVEVVGSTPEQFAALIRTEIPRMAAVIAAAGIAKID